MGGEVIGVHAFQNASNSAMQRRALGGAKAVVEGIADQDVRETKCAAGLRVLADETAR